MAMEKSTRRSLIEELSDKEHGTTEQKEQGGFHRRRRPKKEWTAVSGSRVPDGAAALQRM